MRKQEQKGHNAPFSFSMELFKNLANIEEEKTLGTPYDICLKRIEDCGTVQDILSLCSEQYFHDAFTTSENKANKAKSELEKQIKKIHELKPETKEVDFI